MKRATSAKSLGSLLRTVRTRLDLTQKALARMLEIKASYLSYLESDQRRPSIALVTRMAATLRIESGKLLPLAYPETGQFAAPPRAPRRDAWKAFSSDPLLQRLYHVNQDELALLRHISQLGHVADARDLLFVLAVVRQALAGGAVPRQLVENREKRP